MHKEKLLHERSIINKDIFAQDVKFAQKNFSNEESNMQKRTFE